MAYTYRKPIELPLQVSGLIDEKCEALFDGVPYADLKDVGEPEVRSLRECNADLDHFLEFGVGMGKRYEIYQAVGTVVAPSAFDVDTYGNNRKTIVQMRKEQQIATSLGFSVRFLILRGNGFNMARDCQIKVKETRISGSLRLGSKEYEYDDVSKLSIWVADPRSVELGPAAVYDYYRTSGVLSGYSHVQAHFEDGCGLPGECAMERIRKDIPFLHDEARLHDKRDSAEVKLFDRTLNAAQVFRREQLKKRTPSGAFTAGVSRLLAPYMMRTQ